MALNDAVGVQRRGPRQAAQSRSPAILRECVMGLRPTEVDEEQRRGHPQRSEGPAFFMHPRQHSGRQPRVSRSGTGQSSPPGARARGGLVQQSGETRDASLRPEGYPARCGVTPKSETGKLSTLAGTGAAGVYPAIPRHPPPSPATSREFSWAYGPPKGMKNHLAGRSFAIWKILCK